MLLSERATLDREVLCECIDKAAVHRAVARYNALTRQFLLVLPEVGAAMAYEHIQLDKAVLIEEQV